ncbi:MAG: matrixin family metalloprotease [Nanoarchaeota archaeon]
MSISDTIVIILTIALILGATYIAYHELNSKSIEYKEFTANITHNLPNQSNQFYPNMRFQHKEIPFSIADDCNELKNQEIIQALLTIQSKTPIIFYKSYYSGISFVCSGNASEFGSGDSENEVVAGAAKPEDILNLTNLYIIQKASVTLLRPEKCQTPQVVIHETLHALGFDHSSDENSILYPITNCKQKIDPAIFEELNRLYSIPENPDLVIEKIEANKTGKYLNLKVNVANYGLSTATNITLEISSNKKLIKSYNFDQIDIGKRTQLTLENLRTVDSESINFQLKMAQQDLNEENNYAQVLSLGQV